MTIPSISKHQQIGRCWRLIASVQELNHISAGIVASVGNIGIEKVFRVSHNIRHAMPKGIKIEPFDELNTLPLLTVVIAIGRIMPTVGSKVEETIVEYPDVSITVQRATNHPRVHDHQHQRQ